MRCYLFTAIDVLSGGVGSVRSVGRLAENVGSGIFQGNSEPCCMGVGGGRTRKGSRQGWWGVW